MYTNFENWKADEEIKRPMQVALTESDIERELFRIEAETRRNSIGELLWDLETVALESQRPSYRKEAAGYKNNIEKLIGCREHLYDAPVEQLENEEVVSEAVIRLAILKYYI